MDTVILKGYEIPKGLSRRGRSAAVTICRVLRESSIGPVISSGGSRVFYTPAEWAAKGHDTEGTELIVVHDGGDHMPYFYNRDGSDTLVERMSEALRQRKVYAEPRNGWCTAIYPM